MALRALLIAVFILTLFLPTASASTVVASTERPTTVREYADWLAFSVYDETAGLYRLTVRTPDGQLRVLPIEGSRAPFDVDIGPDSAREPELIYSRCRHERTASLSARAYERRGCDLYVFSLVRPTGERPVRNANTSDSDEVQPTLWRGDIAFVRRYDGRERPVVYTKPLIAPRSRPSERRPSIPKRRNGEPTTDPAISGLELYGRRLAQSVVFGAVEPSDRATIRRLRNEVRLVDLKDDSSRPLAEVTTTGVGSRVFLGLSFAEGRVGWHRTCLGEPCDGVAYRYRIKTGLQQRAPTLSTREGWRAVTGFALTTQRRAYLAATYIESRDGCDTRPQEPADSRRCPIILTDPLAFVSGN